MNHINNTENENRISMKPIEKKSLYLKISDAIYRYIQMNNLQPGDKLPSERDMSSMLQTSRNSVREALRILEDRGLIYVKTGSGVFINNPYGENNSFTIQLTNCSLEEIEELQSALDHKAVENAMERGTFQEKDQLVSTAAEMVKLAGENLYSHVLDRSFHDRNDSIWLATIPQHLMLAQALKDRDMKIAIQAIDEINEYGFEIAKKRVSN